MEAGLSETTYFNVGGKGSGPRIGTLAFGVRVWHACGTASYNHHLQENKFARKQCSRDLLQTFAFSTTKTQINKKEKTLFWELWRHLRKLCLCPSVSELHVPWKHLIRFPSIGRSCNVLRTIFANEQKGNGMWKLYWRPIFSWCSFTDRAFRRVACLRKIVLVSSI